MSAAASAVIPGAGMVQNIIEKMSDQIVAMVDEILTEKADAMMYELIQPQIEQHLKTIFESYPVQMEASKMFNREIFPIYKSTIDDFSNFNNIIKATDGKIDKTIEEYARMLYKAFRAADHQGLAKVKIIPPSGIGLAASIVDRINKASAKSLKGKD